jgi:hypothetical protein
LMPKFDSNFFLKNYAVSIASDLPYGLQSCGSNSIRIYSCFCCISVGILGSSALRLVLTITMACLTRFSGCIYYTDSEAESSVICYCSSIISEFIIYC